MVKCLNAAGAEGVSAVYEYAGDAFTHVVTETTKLADIETPRAVIEVKDLRLCRLLLLRGLAARHHYLFYNILLIQ